MTRSRSRLGATLNNNSPSWLSPIINHELSPLTSIVSSRGDLRTRTSNDAHISTDSDSTDSSCKTHANPKMSSKAAHIEQSSANKPPFLTMGEVTPEALRSWEMGCAQFFMHKNVAEDDMVKKIAWGMQDLRIQDWCLMNQEEMDLMTFKEYMAEVRRVWLPSGWADIVRCKMLASMQGQCPFSEWAIDVQSQNTLL
ncbi:uncharacterized protein F5891DRAFT_1190260 [Suillus fuscotomentosus]|uniref:Uncharacterized protein n=1 Tax=Suillus fuscotomentosus TaxID=1912939 RepID=A0AAD4E3K0_9AGAM|nr:uncharacterized protein F5891DRAFT_1190260 [Suillus fuscotomentosus]KAG1899065.1 hypothetical protein F5891DRAFT_1190260 [Suillus fuscotomentosus]